MSDRTVATDALETLGSIIDEHQKRDAIHLAVVPAIAGHRMRAGEHVSVVNGVATSNDADPIGIVDPFLPGTLVRGQRFWLVIYPRKITSLRHVWSHPAFPDEVPSPQLPADRSASEAWMRKWAVKHLSDDYDPRSEDAAYADALLAGSDLHVGSYESAPSFIDSTWWDHWEVLTGLKGDRGGYFRCSC